MKYPSRIYYTEADKALMWDRWQRGESLHSIAGHFWPQSFIDPGDLVAYWRHSPSSASSFLEVTVAGGARRDIPRYRIRAVVTAGRIAAGPCAIDTQSRAQPQWRTRAVPCPCCGPGGLGSGAAPQAL